MLLELLCCCFGSLYSLFFFTIFLLSAARYALHYVRLPNIHKHKQHSARVEIKKKYTKKYIKILNEIMQLTRECYVKRNFFK